MEKELSLAQKCGLGDIVYSRELMLQKCVEVHKMNVLIVSCVWGCRINPETASIDVSYPPSETGHIYGSPWTFIMGGAVFPDKWDYDFCERRDSSDNPKSLKSLYYIIAEVLDISPHYVDGFDNGFMLKEQPEKPRSHDKEHFPQGVKDGIWVREELERLHIPVFPEIKVKELTK